VAHLPDDLLKPGSWPEPRPGAVELVETHVSWVLRGEREVFKVKKPVNLGFLDFRSPERRREACEDEVRLNARLGGGTYLGVVPVTDGEGGALRLGGHGLAVDWAVHMHRLDDACRSDALLARGAFGFPEVDALADVLSRFHAGADVAPEVAARWASPEAVARNVRENFEQTRALAPEFFEEEAAREVERAQLADLSGKASLLEARVRQGFVRDGHGDLRLEHVYFQPEGLSVIDCIEFDERYRVGDTCADIAFLSMDMAAHGRVDLAERLLARYARASDDYDLYGLVDFYEGYRAWVRAKVAAILARDPSAGEVARQRAAAEARRHLTLALACNRSAAAAPSLVAVGGVIASGKSTVSEVLAVELSCPIVDADRTRKHLLGVPEERPLHDPAWQGAYAPEVSTRVYDEVARRASVVLASGRSVVVDASLRSRALRAKMQDLARRSRVPFCFVECRAPLDACRERLARRLGGPSDGRLEVFDAFAQGFEAVDELAPSEHLVVDTTRPLEGSLAPFRERVTTWPRGLTG
jgi:aminoglycoside phosphotransferase family enzyme/predicted kinase